MWRPESSAERKLVLGELTAILASSHFRNSKRYPALLKYVVDQTLEGHEAELKERTLGVEVFERPAGYDTNTDPVVRFSAGEIRKRIAQYYHETGEDSVVQIELPLGSYVPEFRMRTGAESVLAHELPLVAPQPHLEVEAAPSPVQVSGVEPRVLRTQPARRVFWALPGLSATLLVAAFAAAIGIAVFLVPRFFESGPPAGFWRPLLQAPGPVLIVMGSGHPELATPQPGQTSLAEQMHGPQSHISLPSALALSRVSASLERHGRTPELKESSGTTLTDLRSRSSVLVGGLNNLWTLRLVAPLRFHFVWDPLPRIEDREKPGERSWAVDFAKPVSAISSDYALIARYHDATTNGEVLVIAGVGPFGTEAASEFVASPRYLEQMAKALPRDWEKKNLELVIKTDVIAGEAGPPSIVAATTW